MIILRDKEYSLLGTRILYKIKRGLRRGKSNYRLARESIEAQNKVIDKLARLKTKVEGKMLEYPNPQTVTAKAAGKVPGIAEGMIKNPVAGTLVSPVGSAVGGSIIRKFFPELGFAEAYSIASPITSTLGAASGKIIRGGRGLAWKLGKRLSRSNNKVVKKSGNVMRKGLVRGRRLNRSYKEEVNDILNYPKLLANSVKYPNPATLVERTLAERNLLPSIKVSIPSFQGITNRVKEFVPRIKLPRLIRNRPAAPVMFRPNYKN